LRVKDIHCLKATRIDAKMDRREMTLEDKINQWLQQPGTAVSSAEFEFIRNMRRAATAGVGYGWMQQIIEWEWNGTTDGKGWGPEYFSRIINFAHVKEDKAMTRKCEVHGHQIFWVGVFHQFSNEGRIALVEKGDGTVEKVDLQHCWIRFIQGKA